ncbi:MAG: TolC family protein [Planctomycetes bacterium]|nr:TolC family protein [Planctomycetota bacterium]
MRDRNLLGALSLSVIAFTAGCAQTSSHRVAKVPAPAASQHTELASPRSDAVDGSEHVASTGSEIRLVGAEDLPVPPAAATDAFDELASETIPSGVMTLADLENLAMGNNPTLSQAAAAVDQQRGEYRQSGLYPNPQVGYLNTTANQTAPKQSNGMFFSQEFVTAKKIPLAQAANSQEIKRLQWDQQSQRIRVLNDVKIRYYEVLGAQRQVTVNQELVRLARQHLEAAQSLFDAKTASRTDVLQASVLVETSRIRVAEATHRLEAAWEQLAAMVGVPTLPLSEVSDTGADNIPVLDLETEWQRMLNESPQLRSAQSELDHGMAVLRQARAQAKPNFTVQVVADYDRVTQSTTASTLVALPLPVFNRNQGNIDKASADIRADQADIVRSQLVLRDQLADSFRRYKTSRLQADKLKESILPAVEENLKLTMTAYKGGEISFRDVLTAQEAYAQSQIARIEAITEAHKVAVEITGMQLTGGLNPAAIGSAIQSQPGGSQRQRALLQDVQDQATKQLLPAAQIGR